MKQTKKKNEQRPKHEKDNLTILKLCGAADGDAFPSATPWRDNVIMWNSEIGRVIAEDFGVDAWTAKGATVRRKYGAEEGDFEKNCLFIGYRLIEAWEQNKKSASLEKLCKVIIDFALVARQPPAPAAPAEAVQ